MAEQGRHGILELFQVTVQLPFAELERPERGAKNRIPCESAARISMIIQTGFTYRVINFSVAARFSSS